MLLKPKKLVNLFLLLLVIGIGGLWFFSEVNTAKRKRTAATFQHPTDVQDEEGSTAKALSLINHSETTQEKYTVKNTDKDTM